MIIQTINWGGTGSAESYSSISLVPAVHYLDTSRLLQPWLCCRIAWGQTVHLAAPCP